MITKQVENRPWPAAELFVASRSLKAAVLFVRFIIILSGLRRDATTAI